MQLPPPEKRIAHYPYLVDLGSHDPGPLNEKPEQ